LEVTTGSQVSDKSKTTSPIHNRTADIRRLLAQQSTNKARSIRIKARVSLPKHGKRKKKIGARLVA
jgi:hypothetical protein